MITPVRIAHRGASGQELAPENTLAALDLAIELGVDIVEIDVQASRDGQIVVIHDPTLDRTTSGSGPVQAHTLEQIRALDAGAWHSVPYAGERVPLLEEVLELARHRALVLIEIKADYIAERVLQIVAEMRAEEQVIIQAFSPQVVQRVNLLAPRVPTALLMGDLPTAPSRIRARKLVQQVLAVGANALAIWHATLTPQLLEEMRQRAIGVWSWTVDEEIIMRDLVLLGVQGIITNYPNRLNRVLRDLESEGRLQMPQGRRMRRSRWGRRRQLRKLRGQSPTPDEP